MDSETVELMNNPIRNADHILKQVQSRTSTKFMVGPLWHKDIATGALRLECPSLLLQSYLHDA